MPPLPDAQPDLPGPDWGPNWSGGCPRAPATPPGPRGPRGPPRPPTSRRPPLGTTPPQPPERAPWAATRPPGAGRAGPQTDRHPPNRLAAPFAPPPRGLLPLFSKIGTQAPPKASPPGRPQKPENRPFLGPKTPRPPPAGRKAVPGGWHANRRQEPGPTPLPWGPAASISGSAHARKKPPVCYTVTFCRVLRFASAVTLRVCLRSLRNEAGRLVTAQIKPHSRNLIEISGGTVPVLS